MARGGCEKMTASISDRAIAGSSMRSSRTGSSWPAVFRVVRGTAVRHLQSCRLLRRVGVGGAENGGFGHLRAVKMGDDAPLVEDIDPVTLEQFFHFGRVPQEGPAPFRFGPDET